MEIIGLSGYARSGKDEAAKVLVEDFGFQRIAFADKLREVLYALNPIVYAARKYDAGNHPDGWTQVYIQDVIDNYGWDGYKETEHGPEIRRLLQRLGTEAGREALWDTIWIDAALANLDDNAKVVVSDARFFNEFDAIRERGGDIWRIERPGVGPANEHASENEAPNYQHFNHRIINDGTLDDLREKVRDVYTYRSLR